MSTFEIRTPRQIIRQVLVRIRECAKREDWQLAANRGEEHAIKLMMQAPRAAALNCETATWEDLLRSHLVDSTFCLQCEECEATNIPVARIEAGRGYQADLCEDCIKSILAAFNEKRGEI